MRPASAHTNLAQNPLYIDVFPDVKHVYTTGDIVHGVLRVDPTTRPQNVSIFFKGISILHDKDSQGCKTEFFRLKQELFTSSGTGENYDILRHGTAEDGKVELTFQFTFPHVAVQAPPAGRKWHYSKDSYDHPRFQHSPGFLLPPSCTTFTSVDTTVAPTVLYYLEAILDSSLKILQEVKFLPPAPEYDLSLLQPNLDFGNSLPKQQCRYKFIRTRKLLPDYEEKKGNKLRRMKDFLVDKELFFGIQSFSEIPYCRFNVLATPPRVIVMGSNFPIHITLQHLDRSASIPEPPSLFLRRVRVEVISTYEIFVPQPNSSVNCGAEHINPAQRTTILVDKKSTIGKGEPLLDGMNLSNVVELRISEADERLLPSFSSYGIALEHELQVVMWGECVRNEWAGIVCRDKVQLVSGWTFSHIPEDEGETGLGQPLAMQPPPAYPPPEYGAV